MLRLKRRIFSPFFYETLPQDVDGGFDEILVEELTIDIPQINHPTVEEMLFKKIKGDDDDA